MTGALPTSSDGTVDVRALCAELDDQVNGTGHLPPHLPEFEPTDADRLARGESVPGAPGACTNTPPGSSDTCGHSRPWHRPRSRIRSCEQCDCPRYKRQE